MLCLGLRDSYVWGLVFLRFGVSNSQVWELVLFVMFGAQGFLRWEVSFLTFGGL